VSNPLRIASRYPKATHRRKASQIYETPMRIKRAKELSNPVLLSEPPQIRSPKPKSEPWNGVTHCPHASHIKDPTRKGVSEPVIEGTRGSKASRHPQKPSEMSEPNAKKPKTCSESLKARIPIRKSEPIVLGTHGIKRADNFRRPYR
jgi:hypothetical protein